jgi:hypothetical protein
VINIATQLVHLCEVFHRDQRLGVNDSQVFAKAWQLQNVDVVFRVQLDEVSAHCEGLYYLVL